MKAQFLERIFSFGLRNMMVTNLFSVCSLTLYNLGDFESYCLLYFINKMHANVHAISCCNDIVILIYTNCG